MPGKEDAPLSGQSENFKKRSMHALVLARTQITAASLIFFIFVLAGLVYSGGSDGSGVFDVLKEAMEELASQVSGKGFFGITIFIFLNNLKAAFSAVILGPLFGVVPALQAAANGAIIGVVIREAASRSSALMLLLGLMPHGIFEIPAMLISWGLGIWLGLWPLKSIRGDGLGFIGRSKMALGVMLRIVLPLLAIAALIEGALISLLTS